MKLISEKEITTFSKWWELNKSIYKQLNISREITYIIWVAAVDSFEDAMRKQLNKYRIK